MAQSTPKRRLLVTNALPYANGPIHVGHLVGYIQADIWVRFQRLLGHECWYICGDDAHGTPIMLHALQQNISPEALIQQLGIEHKADFKDFHIDFDNFYTTHSDENRQLSEFVYSQLKDRGDITTSVISQAYDPIKKIFLPDRYVKGTCPKCRALDQYGDSCEACGATYTPTELINPVSVISGAQPIQQQSEHLFFELKNYQSLLREWIESGTLQSEVSNKLQEWLTAPLKPWDISRDEPYFGFKIPGYPHKYFYVWLDAPIGYIASFKHLCDRQGNIDFNSYWMPCGKGEKSEKTELYHFIGKDIIYFHGLFWPALLHGAGFRLPTGIFANGFLTINGLKMSKSRGTFIKARTYLQHLNPEYLRYYFAAKLGNGCDDLDLNFEDFKTRVNADLVGKFINIASRTAGFVQRFFDSRLGDRLTEPSLFNKFVATSALIAKYYDQREFGQAAREIMQLCDLTNRYIDEQKPWVLAKSTQPQDRQTLGGVCTVAINAFRQLCILLKPIIPSIIQQAELFLNQPNLRWSDLDKPLLNHEIRLYTPLLERISNEAIQALQPPS